MKSLSKCFPQYTLQTYNKYIIRANNNENKSKEMKNKKLHGKNYFAAQLFNVELLS